MSNENRKSIGINSLDSQLMKQHFVYDVSERLTDLYETVTEATHGSPCIVTRYTYISPTSFKVQAMREENAVWDSAWDI